MNKVIQFIGGFPNGFVSKLSLMVLLVCCAAFLVVGVVQVLKNKNGIYNFKTEWLSILVAEALYIVCFIIYIAVFKKVFVLYELLAILSLGVFTGVFASLIAEKLFQQKK